MRYGIFRDVAGWGQVAVKKTGDTCDGKIVRWDDRGNGYEDMAIYDTLNAAISAESAMVKAGKKNIYIGAIEAGREGTICIGSRETHTAIGTK